MGLLAVELIPDYSDALAPRGHIRVGGQGTAHSALPAGRVSPQATVKNPALTLPHIEPHTVERAIVGDGQTWTVVRAGINRPAIEGGALQCIGAKLIGLSCKMRQIAQMHQGVVPLVGLKHRSEEHTSELQ